MRASYGSVEMLARQREPEGAELVMQSEGQGSGEEPGKQLESSREGPSGVGGAGCWRCIASHKVGDGTGEVSRGWKPTSAVTADTS